VPDEGAASAETDPSPVSNSLSLIRATLSHKGRGEESEVICPTGVLPGFRVQPFLQKFFASPFGRNSFIDSHIPCPSRGAFRDRQERWVRDAVDAAVSKTNDADPPSLKLRRDRYQDRRAAFSEGGRGRRSRVVLTPRRWCQVLEKQASQGRWWQESPVTRESAEETVKTIRVRECRVFRRPAVTNACAFYTAHAAAGATGTRHSPRPPFRGWFLRNSGGSAPRERGVAASAV
jgi:hypothetical protein